MKVIYKNKVIRTAILLASCFVIIGIAVHFFSQSQDTVNDGYLMRGDYGTGSVSENLQAETDGKKTDVELSIGARKYTGSQVKNYLDSAESSLKKAVLGDLSEDHVDHDIKLVTALPDSPVKISWMTTPVKLMDTEGKLGDIPDEGASVRAEAELVLEEEVRTYILSLMVYPKVMTYDETLQKKAQEAVSAEDASEQKISLPSVIDGKKVIWSRQGGDSGMMIASLGIIAALLFVYSEKKKITDAAARKKSQLILDYPHIISKLILLINAGMSMRSAFTKMTADYQKSKTRGGHIRAGYEEIARISADTGRGISESEAYHAFGERCGLAKYRTLSVLLVQNLRCGSDQLAGLLQKEAADAFEERKKQARVLGEEAGTKLLFPMILMLLVVMAIIMVPAFLSF